MSMLQCELEQQTNPHQWMYKRMMTGQLVDVVRYDSMIRRFYDAEKLRLIQEMCRVSGKIAIAANLLTRSQRAKYAENRMKSGRTSFYLFDAPYIPADVGCRVDLDPETLVYTDILSAE
ncbi:hypothetical protein [Paenibacillus alvei]|uniref:hypothetical protein n=1 Tax=Paenibacillus alvei TaxID=44250 RepID=UPI0022819B5E|nr:hypothetical protein [Paenibacillus alvei]MCY7486727.1 hypothetical protein [Paenibacillus alvei]